MRHRTLIAAAAIATAALAPSAAQADSTTFAAFNVVRLAGIQAHVPLKLVGGQASMRCDDHITNDTPLPFKTACGIKERWAGAQCFVSLRLDEKGHATGQVICGRGAKAKGFWAWSTKYNWNGKRFQFSDPETAGPIPWA